MSGEELLALIGNLLTEYFAGAASPTFVVADPDDSYVYVFQRGENVYHFAIGVSHATVEVGS